MQEHRQRRAQSLVDENLLGRVAEVVVAADDVRDAHGHVVDDHRQVVGDGAVGTLDDEVADGLVGELDRRPQHVFEDGRAGRHTKAQRPGLAGGLAPRHFVGGQVAAAAAVHPGALLGLCRLSPGLELLRRAEARVEVPAGHELVDVLAVDVRTLGLPVRPVGAGHARPFVPVKAHLAQRAQDLLYGLVGGARHVGVLDAQDEHTVVLSGVDEVVEPRAGAAQVQVPGR